MNKDMVQEVLDNVFSTDYFNTKIILTIAGAVLTWAAGLLGFFLESVYQFEAVTAVILLDFVFGVWLAIKNKEFDTRKAAKVVGYLFIYNMLLAGILLVERGYPAAFFLSEAVMIPIIGIQLISVIKKIRDLGYITSAKATEIIDNIDRFKNRNKAEDEKESL